MNIKTGNNDCPLPFTRNSLVMGRRFNRIKKRGASLLHSGKAILKWDNQKPMPGPLTAPHLIKTREMKPEEFNIISPNYELQFSQYDGDCFEKNEVAVRLSVNEFIEPTYAYLRISKKIYIKMFEVREEISRRYIMLLCSKLLKQIK